MDPDEERVKHYLEEPDTYCSELPPIQPAP